MLTWALPFRARHKRTPRKVFRAFLGADVPARPSGMSRGTFGVLHAHRWKTRLRIIGVGSEASRNVSQYHSESQISKQPLHGPGSFLMSQLPPSHSDLPETPRQLQSIRRVGISPPALYRPLLKCFSSCTQNSMPSKYSR